MEKRAILFGSIGTIVETSKIQQEAFNRAFQEAGLDWHWADEEYAQMLKKSGGRQRIADYAAAHEETADAKALHERKTEIFNQMIAYKGLAPRKGVLPLMKWARQNDVKLGFVTTTSRNNIEAIFLALDGALHRSSFDYVGDIGKVDAGKPDPEIYYKAMSALEVVPQQCLAIEDTGIALQSALDAGIECVAFPGVYADRNDFTGASRVIDRVDPHYLPLLDDKDALRIAI